MKRYLVFDAHCGMCRELATSIKKTANAKLEILSIYDPIAIGLLDQVFPKGWIHAPYLVVIEEDDVYAYSGARLSWQLLKLTGPQGIRIYWKALHYKNKQATLNSAPLSPMRRNLLKVGLGIGIGAILSRYLDISVFEAKTAYAGNCPCSPCTGSCYITKYDEYCGCEPTCSPCPNICDYLYDYTCYCDECGSFFLCRFVMCDDAVFCKCA
jgi:hypothetical protein